MAKKLSYDESLLAALATASLGEADVIFDTQVNADSQKSFIAASLALRAWFRHEVLKEKPNLIVSHEKSKLVMFGGTSIEVTQGVGLVINEAPSTARGSVYIMAAPTYRGLKSESEGSGWASTVSTEVTGRMVEVSDLGTYLVDEATRAIEQLYGGRATTFVTENSGANASKLVSTLRKVEAYLSKKKRVSWWSQKADSKRDRNFVGKLLWDCGILDKQVFSLATKVAGFKFTLPLYNQVLANKELTEKRVKEAPNMAQLLVTMRQVSGYLTVPELNCADNVWQVRRDEFMALGGAPVGWRWLSHQGYALIRLLNYREGDGKKMVGFINEMGTAQVGRLPAFRGLVNHVYWDDVRRAEVMRMLSIAFLRQKVLVSDIKAKLPLLTDYLQSHAGISLKGATWTSVMRRQVAWHRGLVEAQLAKSKLDQANRQWSSLCPDVVRGEFTAKSLNTSDELREEGQLMLHCVGGYDMACFANKSRIYSIRKNGERVATVEVKLTNKGWALGQLYGTQNTVVKDPLVTKLTNQLVAICRRSPALTQTENRILRESPVRVNTWLVQQNVAQEEEEGLIPF